MYPYRKRCRGELLPESLGWRCHSEPRFEPKSSGCCCWREYLETDHILRSAKKAFKKRKKCQKIEKKIAKDPPAKTRNSLPSCKRRACLSPSALQNRTLGTLPSRVVVAAELAGRQSFPPSLTSPTPGRRVQAPKNQDTELWGGLPLGPCPCKHLVCPKRFGRSCKRRENRERRTEKGRGFRGIRGLTAEPFNWLMNGALRSVAYRRC